MNQKPIIIQGPQMSGKSTLIRAMYKNAAFMDVENILKSVGNHYLTDAIIVEVYKESDFNTLVEVLSSSADRLPIPFIIETNQDFGHPEGFSLIKCERINDEYNFKLIL
jgi:molybdopterin-guanine dinucleotide biosynthesis protein